jgi:formylglycine-generating enzyme required for sulfatase activity
MGQNSQGLPLWEHDASGIIFVELPGGTVNLGAQSAEAGDPNFDVDAEASEDNLPGSDPLDGDGRAHLVTLGPFLIAESEVTQAQYQAVTGTNPSSFTGDLQRPVENLEWNKLHETARFDGQGGFTGVDGFLERACLSLPTEAQWEYACRAGQEAPISGNGAIDDMGWYGGNSDTGSGQETHPVKTKAPNQFGLFDMHGNVLEMCEDVFDSDFYAAAAAAGPDPLRGCTPGSNCGLSRRVTRGGGYGSSSGDCRSSTRGGFLSQGGTYPSVGFRPVFDVPRCSETDCGDGVDNDLDHATDCDDSDCAADLACDAGCGAEPAPIDGFTLLGCNAQGSFEWQHDQTGIICVQLPGGTFDMGGQSVEATDPNYDAAAEDSEGPVHPVTLSAFLIGKYEVTQCQWEALMGSNPSFFSGDPGDGDRPVDSATWNEVHGGFGVEGGFLQRTCPPLSLPTEAQWEYACRAGQEAPYSGNGILDDMGWHFNHRAGGYHDDSGTCKGRETHPVGQRQANQFGLFDMHGNVEEFCEDNHNPNFYSTPEAAGPDPLFDCICGTSKRITRGGSWYGGATEGRSSSRGGYAGQGTRYEWVGFRVAFPVPGP